MGADYLIDTNIVIYLLDRKLTPAAESFLANIVDEACQLSVISQIELLSWLPPRSQDKFIVEAFVADCQIIDLSPPNCSADHSIAPNLRS